MKRTLLALGIILFTLSCQAQQTIINPVVPTAGSISLTATPSTIPVGSTLNFTARMQDTNNQPNILVTDKCLPTSSDPTILLIGAYGSASGVAAGTVQVFCTVGAGGSTTCSAAGCISNTINVTVVGTPAITNPPPSCGSPCVLNGATNGTSYPPFTFAATGGVLPYTWSNSSGSPPTGMSLSSAGVLSGTPSVNGTTIWTVKVTDSTTAFATLQVSLTVSAPAGGPPTYTLSNTTLTFFALPSVPPQMGPNTCTAGFLTQCGNLTGADTTITDPNLGGIVTRITDVNVMWPTDANQSAIVSVSGSGEMNDFNCNSELVMLGNSPGGWTFPMTFGPVAGSSHRLYATSSPSQNGFVLPGAFFGFSRQCPTTGKYLAYTLKGSDSATIQSYDFTGYSPTATVPTPTTVYSFKTSANCLGSGYSVTWSTAGGLSSGDTDFAAGFSSTGSQNTGHDVVVYRAGSGCRHLDFTTGAVTGDWGPTGSIPSDPCLNTIHNVEIFKTAGWARITTGGGLGSCASGSAYLWNYGSGSLTGSLIAACVVAYCGGHNANGLAIVINNSGDGNPNFMAACTVGSTCPTGSSSGIINATPTGKQAIDFHYGWNVLNDAWPVLGTSWIAAAPTAAWTNEVMGFRPTLVGGTNPFRFAQTENTGLNSQFGIQQAIPGFSQDGKWALFGSDWQGTLGSTGGATTCTLTTNCRGDVFAVALK